MAYVEQWSTDQANNNKSPPLGAPEGGLPHDRISDTFRVVMAGVREVYEAMLALEPDNAAGADNATKFGGRTRQQFYDDIWPVGSERGWNSTTGTGLVPTGITATWTLVAKDCLLVGADGSGTYSTVGATVGSGTSATTASDGAHTHSGATGSTALTINQMPLHGHPMRISEAAGTADVIGGLMLDDDNVSNYSAYTGTPSNNVGEQIGGTGGGAGHTHTISSDGAHTHTVTLPKRYVTAWFKRTA